MNNQLKYSICCLFRDYSKYINLNVFLEKIGFVGDVENLSIDNIDNKFDSYQALRYFIEKSSGDYIIILHDDVELSSNKRDELDIQINSCLRKDPQAAIFGIAGKHKKILAGKGHFVSYRGDEFWGFQDQGIVQTLDECFLIIRKDSGVTVSKGLSGFHFYGTDLCLNAADLGYTSYVIDFPIIHRSQGTLNEDFYAARDRFQEHLRNRRIHRCISTTCTVLYGGRSKIIHSWALIKSLDIARRSNHKDLETVINETNLRLKKLGYLYIISRVFLEKFCQLDFSLNYFRIFYWKQIHRPIAPARRIWTDIGWWLRNWSSRI